MPILWTSSFTNYHKSNGNIPDMNDEVFDDEPKEDNAADNEKM